MASPNDPITEPPAYILTSTEFPPFLNRRNPQILYQPAIGVAYAPRLVKNDAATCSVADPEVKTMSSVVVSPIISCGPHFSVDVVYVASAMAITLLASVPVDLSNPPC